MPTVPPLNVLVGQLPARPPQRGQNTFASVRNPGRALGLCTIAHARASGREGRNGRESAPGGNVDDQERNALWADARDRNSRLQQRIDAIAQLLGRSRDVLAAGPARGCQRKQVLGSRIADTATAFMGLASTLPTCKCGASNAAGPGRAPHAPAVEAPFFSSPLAPVGHTSSCRPDPRSCTASRPSQPLHRSGQGGAGASG